MRMVAVVLSVLGLLLTVGVPAGGARAGMLAAPGPNPNWTDMQKFEWDLGFMARAAQICGSHTEAAVLHRLARMSPYGSIGLRAVTGDGFARPVCGGINNDAKALVADAKKIEEYLEATYSCRGEDCYGQSLSDWQFHACADAVKSHLASRAVEKEQIREVTIANIRQSGATLDFQARVQLKSCQGSLYVDLKESCAVKRDYTRGDCEIGGVERY